MIHADRCHSLSGAGRLDVVALGATVNALGRPGFWRQCQGLPWRVTELKLCGFSNDEISKCYIDDWYTPSD